MCCCHPDGLNLELYRGSQCDEEGSCPNANTSSDESARDGAHFGSFTFPIGTFSTTTAAGTITINYDIVCPDRKGYGASKMYLVDNVVLARTA